MIWFDFGTDVHSCCKHEDICSFTCIWLGVHQFEGNFQTDLAAE